MYRVHNSWLEFLYSTKMCIGNIYLVFTKPMLAAYLALYGFV